MGMYRNYKCRLCGAIISRYSDSNIVRSITPYGLMMSRKEHTTCRDLEEGESALCDFVSVSEMPLARAAEVYHSAT